MLISSSVSGAVAGVQAAIAAAGTLQGQSPFALRPVLNAIAAAVATFDSEAARIEALIDETTLGGVVAGGSPPVMIATFQAQMLAVQQLAYLRTARGYLGRMLLNVRNAPG